MDISHSHLLIYCKYVRNIYMLNHFLLVCEYLFQGKKDADLAYKVMDIKM